MELEPDDDYSSEDNLPINNVGMPLDTTELTITVNWEYSSGTTGEGDIIMTFQATDPPNELSMHLIHVLIKVTVKFAFHNKNKKNVYWIYVDDYIACTEENFGGTAPTIDLAGRGKVNIASPNYPNIYYDDSDCHWDFTTSTPGKVIQLTLLSWDVSV